MRLLLILLATAVSLAGPSFAQEARTVFGPAIPEATGEPHPEGNAYMRRWHMSMMKHDRDKTVYEGARDVNASLGECFECHTVKDEAGTPVTYADDRHFCRVCHDFTAVKVDCFDCHRSTPEGFEEPAAHAFSAPAQSLAPRDLSDDERIHAYLNDVTAAAAKERQ